MGSELLRLGTTTADTAESGRTGRGASRRRPRKRLLSQADAVRTDAAATAHLRQTRSRSRRPRCATTRANLMWSSPGSAGPGPADESCTTTSCDTRRIELRNRPRASAMPSATANTRPGDRAAPADRAAHAGSRCEYRTSPTSRKSTSPSSRPCVRSSTNDLARRAERLTVLPFLMRAIVLAVPAFPQMNARFDDEQGIVTRFDAVNIGIATQTDAGLMVPVVRHAEARDLWASAAEVVGWPTPRARARQPATSFRDRRSRSRASARSGHRFHAGDQCAGSGHRGREPDRRAARHARERESCRGA